MNDSIQQALQQFTHEFIEQWKNQYGELPFDETLLDVPSPCVQRISEGKAYWLPQTMSLPITLKPITDAVDVIVRPEIEMFYSIQYANHLPAYFDDLPLTLIQLWHDDDLPLLQENLICHLVTQRQLKLTPTLFIGTTQNEMEIISINNINGKVGIEKIGTKYFTELASSLLQFIHGLRPRIV